MVKLGVVYVVVLASAAPALASCGDDQSARKQGSVEATKRFCEIEDKEAPLRKLVSRAAGHANDSVPGGLAEAEGRRADAIRKRDRYVRKWLRLARSAPTRAWC